MTTFHHGIEVVEKLANDQAIRTKSTSIIGLIATADDADAAYFPLNVPKLVTKISEAQGKAGTTGTLARALRDIADQSRPVLVIVRVAEGSKTADALPHDATEQQKTDAQAVDKNDAIAKAIGANVAGAYTGAYALLAAETITGAKPKIIGAPELDFPEVAQVLVGVAKQLHGVAYHESHAASVSAAILEAENYGDRESMLIYGRFMRFDTTAQQAVAVSPVGHALGLRAAIDEGIGWHKTLSNVTVAGVSGIDPSRAVHFDLVSKATDANMLNEAKVTCLVNKGGFRFWGNRTGAEDDQFAFESYARTAQILRESIAEAHFSYIDKP